jgi:hypothetical protein
VLDVPTHGTPLGWQGGLDWEVHRTSTGYRAALYDEDMLLAVVESRWRAVLYVRMAIKQRRG